MIFPDFAALLQKHGFTSEAYDFDSTTRGFYHEIYNALIHHSPVFRDCSRIRVQLAVSSEMICCDLFTYNGDLHAAILFFYQQWCEELRYENPVREILLLDRENNFAQIRVLTITRSNAMTFCFNIQ